MSGRISPVTSPLGYDRQPVVAEKEQGGVIRRSRRKDRLEKALPKSSRRTADVVCDTENGFEQRTPAFEKDRLRGGDGHVVDKIDGSVGNDIVFAGQEYHRRIANADPIAVF